MGVVDGGERSWVVCDTVCRPRYAHHSSSTVHRTVCCSMGTDGATVAMCSEAGKPSVGTYQYAPFVWDARVCVRG